MDFTYDIRGKTVHTNDTVVYAAHDKYSQKKMHLETGVVRSISPLGGITVFRDNKKGFRYVKSFAKIGD